MKQNPPSTGNKSSQKQKYTLEADQSMHSSALTLTSISLEDSSTTMPPLISTNSIQKPAYGDPLLPKDTNFPLSNHSEQSQSILEDKTGSS